LSSELVANFKVMKSVNDEWVNTILENIDYLQTPSESDLEKGGGIVTEEFFDFYSEEIINSKGWIEMLKQLGSESKQYESDVEALDTFFR